MKKVEKVEVAYVKKNTLWIVALICLAAGFVGGIFYSDLRSDRSSDVRKYSVEAPALPDNNPQPQLTERVLFLKKQVTDNPRDAEAWAGLGNTYFDLNQYENAIGAYRKHLELKPNNPHVWTDLGIMYRRDKKPTEAIKAFDKAISIDPGHQQSRFNKGVVLLHDLGDPGAARRAWEGLAKINPSFKTPDGRSIGDMVKELPRDLD